MKIVEYEDKYLEDVKDLLVELEEYIVSIDKDNLDLVHPEYRDKMALLDLKKVNENNGKCYLAIENNKAVGLIMGAIFPYDEYDYLDYKCPKRGEIIELIVSKNIRSKGIGKLLMNKMEEYFKSLGCEYVLVDVFAYNENAIKFYNKNNYHNRMHTMIKKINKDKDNYICKIANLNMVIEKFDEEIKNYENKEEWESFKQTAVKNFDNRITYMGLLNGKIITEATAIISNNDLGIQNKDGLLDDKTAYLTAFRTNKAFQGKGYFSELYKFMEKDLKQRGFKKLTLGVEPCEIKNIKIYFNWGYDKYIKTDYEVYPSGEKILVNYYSKDI